MFTFLKVTGTPTYIYEKWHRKINSNSQKKSFKFKDLHIKITGAAMKWTEKANMVLQETLKDRVNIIHKNPKMKKLRII